MPEIALRSSATFEKKKLGWILLLTLQNLIGMGVNNFIM
jgi:hypothetical protein